MSNCKSGFELTNSEILDKVAGGGYTDLQPDITLGMTYCPNCKKDVIAVIGADGNEHCPECGMIFEKSYIV